MYSAGNNNSTGRYKCGINSQKSCNKFATENSVSWHGIQDDLLQRSIYNQYHDLRAAWLNDSKITIFQWKFILHFTPFKNTSVIVRLIELNHCVNSFHLHQMALQYIFHTFFTAQFNVLFKPLLREMSKYFREDTKIEFSKTLQWRVLKFSNLRILFIRCNFFVDLFIQDCN